MNTIDENQTSDPVETVVANQERRLRNGLKNIQIMRGILHKVPKEVLHKVSVILDSLDFDHLTREEAVAVMSSVQAGEWRKAQNDHFEASIDYTAVIEGVTVRLWAAAPPGTCRVVETTEEIPARTITHRKLICA